MTENLRARLASLALACLCAPVGALASPRVVADIAPVGAIAARVMAGAGAPDVLLPPGASPHQFSLAPSDARRLAEAELVFWIGPGLSAWLAGPLDALAGDAEIVELADEPGLELLPARAGGRFPAHDDHDHDHDDGHASQDAHGHDGNGHDGNGHDGNGLSDPHFWLDPRNAAALSEAMAARLSALDPDNAGLYQANAAAFDDEMAALEAELTDALAPVRDRGFLVQHDAFQYFENRFGLEAQGSLAAFDADVPGARRLSDLRAAVEEDGIVCAFTEPQFAPKPLMALADGAGGLRIGTLDPIGAADADYPTLMRELAAQALLCLGEDPA